MSKLVRKHAVLNYETWGHEGPWITLVNGYTRPLNDFRLMGKDLVAHGFRVLAFDNRGAGRTTAEAGFTFTDMAEDIVALWGEVGISRSHLLGVSMGGFLAQSLASERPESIDKLVLVSTACRQSDTRREEKPWSADPEEVAEKLGHYFTDEFAEKNKALVSSMVKQIATQVREGKFAEAAAAQKNAFSGVDLCDRLSNIGARTLIVHGEHDAIIPLDAARRLEDDIPDARLAIVEGAGHLLLAEKPKDLYRTVAHFLASPSSRDEKGSFSRSP